MTLMTSNYQDIMNSPVLDYVNIQTQKPSTKFKLGQYYPHQRDYITCTAREKALVAGLGSGKTYIFVDDEVRKHVDLRGKDGKSNGWVIYPTFDLAEELFIEPFKERLDKVGIKYDYNISRHLFKTQYGRLKIYQLQKPARIIGANLTSVGFDEFDVESWKNCDMAYKKAIGRLRGCDRPQMSFVGTPEGYHYLHKLFVKDKDKGDKAIFHAKTTDNKSLHPSFIQHLMEVYPPQLVDAYLNGQFVNMAQGSVYIFDRNVNVKKNTHPQGRLIAGMDFNVGKMCCAIGYDYGESIHFFDEIVLKNANTYDMVEELKARKYRPVIYPDATGGGRRSSAVESDHHILRRAGFEVISAPRNPQVKDRINAVNGMLRNALGQVRLTVDEKCVEICDDLEQVVYDKYGQVDKSSEERTHMSDAVGYPVYALHGHRVANLRYGRR
jgi:hypothetical protein